MKNSKYGAKKVFYEGIRFDSKAEKDYYLHLLKLKEKGYIKEIILQPKYLIQEKFKKGKKNYREINYIADFEVTFDNGIKIVVDVKGLATETAKLKRKLFDYKYRNLKLIWVKKYRGAWVSI